MTTLALAVVVMILSLSFAFFNGFRDTASVVATMVSTRVFSLREAITMTAVFSAVGALTSTGVARAIATGIVHPDMMPLDALLAGLIGAIGWNLFTWYCGLPSSSSHALIGGVAGAALASVGSSALNPAGFGRILLGFILAPVVGLVIGRLVIEVLNGLLANWTSASVTQYFSKLQIISAAALAFSLGSNTAQKSMGVIAIALFSAKMTATVQVPWWAVLLAAATMGAGTSVGGWRVMKSLRHRMVKLHPVQGFAAESSAALIIQTATLFGLPLPTTHVTSSAIMGVGVSKGFKSVNWGVVRDIVMAILITIPASATVGAICFLIVRAFA